MPEKPCPNCDTPLTELDRSGILIDACRSCRGVWLDRGELDKLLEKERQALLGETGADDDFEREMTGRARDADHPRDSKPSRSEKPEKPKKEKKKTEYLVDLFEMFSER